MYNAILGIAYLTGVLIGCLIFVPLAWLEDKKNKKGKRRK